MRIIDSNCLRSIVIKFYFGESLIFSHGLNFWYVITLYVLILALNFSLSAIKAFNLLILSLDALCATYMFFFLKKAFMYLSGHVLIKNECKSWRVGSERYVSSADKFYFITPSFSRRVLIVFTPPLNPIKETHLG